MVVFEMRGCKLVLPAATRINHVLLTGAGKGGVGEVFMWKREPGHTHTCRFFLTHSFPVVAVTLTPALLRNPGKLD